MPQFIVPLVALVEGCADAAEAAQRVARTLPLSLPPGVSFHLSAVPMPDIPPVEPEAAPAPAKVFTAQHLQDLRAFDPKRYEELLPEIQKAYREGRVR